MVGVLSLRNASWRDDAWKKVAGNNTSQATVLHLGFNWRQFDFGIASALPNEVNNAIIASVNSKTKLVSNYLYSSYQLRNQRWAAGIRLELGQETLNINFTDRITGDQLSFTDDSFAAGILVSAGYQLAADLDLTFEAGLQYSNWSFATIGDLDVGDLDGNRNWISIGINYRFGFTARTLW